MPGVSVGKTVVDSPQGYARSEQSLPVCFLPYKGRKVFEVLFCYFPFAIELVMLGTHFVIGRTIQLQPVYGCLNLLLQRVRQLRVGENMPAYEFRIKPAILNFKRIENIREVPLAAVYCGTGQTVIAPFIRKIRAQRLGTKMLNSPSGSPFNLNSRSKIVHKPRQLSLRGALPEHLP